MTAVPAPDSAPPALSRAWLFLAIGAVLLATLPPQPEWAGAGRHFTQPVLPSRLRDWLDLFQNVVLYAPFGLVMAARGSGLLKTGLLAAALSLLTELLQFLVPGRDSSANDLIANTVGALAGAALMASPVGGVVVRGLMAAERRVYPFVFPATRDAAVLSFVWAAIVTGGLAASAFLMLPAPPEPPYLVSSAVLDPKPGPLLIGANGNPDGFFSGAIDDVRLYARVLDADAIRRDMTRPVGALETAPGAIAAYGFDENAGTQARDATARGHDGAIVRARWTPAGRFGGAAEFDGRSSMIFVPASADLVLTDALTIEAWVFPDERPAPEPAVVAHAGRSYFLSASSEGSPLLPAGGGTFGGAYEDARPVERLVARQWTHLALTYDGQEIRLFVNGTLAATNHRWSSHRAVDATLDTLDLPPGLVANGSQLERGLRSHAAFRATLVCGARNGSSAPAFLVSGRGGIQVFALRTRGNDLALSTATRPRRLGFASPDFHVPGALASCTPGGSIDIATDGPLQNPAVRIDGHPVVGDPAGVALAWGLLFHSELLSAAARTACTVGWLVLLLFPFGFWARPSLPSAIGAAMLVLAFTMVPAFWNIAAIDAIQAAACLAGIVLGWRVRRHESRYPPIPA